MKLAGVPFEGSLRAALRFSPTKALSLIGRYFDLLHRRPALALASGRIRTNFDERFKTGTGLAIEEYLALSHAFTIPYLRPKGNPSEGDSPSNEAADANASIHSRDRYGRKWV
jgi:hypothetical protein